jgi:hypothetical protein
MTTSIWGRACRLIRWLLATGTNLLLCAEGPRHKRDGFLPSSSLTEPTWLVLTGQGRLGPQMRFCWQFSTFVTAATVRLHFCRTTGGRRPTWVSQERLATLHRGEIDRTQAGPRGCTQMTLIWCKR